MSPDQEERLVRTLERISRKEIPSGWLILFGLLLVASALSGCSSAALPSGPQAAFWCSVDASESGAGCDGGVAAPLAAWEIVPSRYVAPVAVVGAKTAGAGLAIGAGETERLEWGVGLGWACPWSLERGLQADQGAVVAGVTVSLTNRGGGD